MRKFHCILLASLLCAAPAMAVDFTTPLLDEKGQPAREGKDDKSAVLTLGSVVATALLIPPQQTRPGEQADPMRLAKRAMLALKVRDAKELTLTAAEVTEVESAVAVFPPLTVLRVIEALDPKAIKE